jgi:mannosyltransferase
MVKQEPLPLPRTVASPAAEASQIGSKKALWLCAIITLAAAILRFHGIAAKSFWLDEGISVGIARLPWSQFWDVLRHREANMALYYLLLRFWMALDFLTTAGGSEGFIRGLSVLFSVATVPVIYALGTRLFGRNTGLVAAWLLAINAYHIRYAEEARGYSLVVFFATLATWIFVRNLQASASNGERAHWGIYALLCALTVYSHFFGALVVVVHFAAFCFLPRGKAPWRNYLWSLRWFAYSMVPIAWIAATVGAGSMKWIPAATFGEVLQFFRQLAGNGGMLLLVLDAVAVILFVAGHFAWHRILKNDEDPNAIEVWNQVLVLAWLAVPVVIVLIGSIFRPLFLGRYLIPCLPALLLIVARSVTWFRPRPFMWALAAAISALCMMGTVSYYHRDFDLDRDDWRAATFYVLDHAIPGDGAFYYVGSGRLPFDFYKSLRNPAPEWPEDLIAANGGDRALHGSLNSYLADALSESKPAGDRVWLILSLDADANGKPREESVMLRAYYGKGRRLVDEQRISGITIALYARDAPGRDSGK